MKDSEPKFPNGWAEHEKEQILFIARNSTPTERYKWLLKALELQRKIHDIKQLEKLK